MPSLTPLLAVPPRGFWHVAPAVLSAIGFGRATSRAMRAPHRSSAALIQVHGLHAGLAARDVVDDGLANVANPVGNPASSSERGLSPPVALTDHPRAAVSAIGGSSDAPKTAQDCASVTEFDRCCRKSRLRAPLTL